MQVAGHLSAALHDYVIGIISETELEGQGGIGSIGCSKDMGGFLDYGGSLWRVWKPPLFAYVLMVLSI